MGDQGQRPPSREPSILERLDFPVFSLPLTDEPVHVMGGYSEHGPRGPHGNVAFHHRLGDGRLVRVHSSNDEPPGDPRYRGGAEGQRALAALRLHFEGGGPLPVTVGEWEGELRVGPDRVRFVGVRCGTVWVADATVAGTEVRVEVAGVEPDEVVLMEVPDHLRRRRAGS